MMIMAHFWNCQILKVAAIPMQTNKIYLLVKSLLNKQALNTESMWERKKEKTNYN